MLKACVCRLGALGDVIQITPIFRELKRQGYEVTFYCKPHGKEITKYDPNIDKFVFHDESVKLEDLKEYLAKNIAPKYDYFVNLGGVVEAGLLRLEHTPEFNLAHHIRHRRYNKNYSDALMEKAGLDIRGQNPELYFTLLEERIAKLRMKKYKGKFVILWSLSGSSFHKTYPFAEYVGEALYKHPDIEVLTVGDSLCELLEWHNTRTHNYSGKWPFRKTMIMTKYVDLVIGTETGVLNAASAFDTPKIVLLSHSSEENLTKYWKNCTNLWADVPCQPCHCLNRTMDGCDKEPGLGSPICMSQIHSKTVYNAIMNIYNQWRSKWQPSTKGQGHFMKKRDDSTVMSPSL